jgi:hypothetical protein
MTADLAALIADRISVALDDQPPQAAPVHAVAGAAHDGDDLLNRRWVCRVAPLVARRAAGVELRQRGG